MTLQHRTARGNFLRSSVTFLVGLVALYGAMEWWARKDDTRVTHEERLSFAEYIDVENPWDTFDYKRADVPAEVLRLSSKLAIHEGTARFRDLAVHYREIVPQMDHPKFHVLLMHGRHYTSQTWVDIGTLRLIAAIGFRVVAVDMPGFGKTKIGRIGDRYTFMSALISALNLTKPVIVTPSWSGYLVLAHTTKYWQNMTGLVAVSPIGWEAFEIACNKTDEENTTKETPEKPKDKKKKKKSKAKNVKKKDAEKEGKDGKVERKEQKDVEKDIEREEQNDVERKEVKERHKKTKDQVYQPLQMFLPEEVPDVSCIPVPTMVVFGDQDRSASGAYLSLLPSSRIAEFSRARHAPYMDNPKLWHKLLYNFLMRLFYESREV
ncbi:putative protein-lysine deacylase ABHD14B isoform X2 [Ornithodoros turicata]|uniref:putative protein-lysine deacylase ABHD14B isoform X2 n=1 Tax=Ornithodoros turicata TaxID=34597 RepID=UPI00313985E6